MALSQLLSHVLTKHCVVNIVCRTESFWGRAGVLFIGIRLEFWIRPLSVWSGVGETICQASRSSVLGKCQLLSARQRCHVQLTKFQCALILGIRHDEALTILFLMRSMRLCLCPVLFRAGCPIGAKSCVGTHGGLVCLTLDLHHVKLKYKLQRSRQEIP